jgi:hypothetical protein
MPSVRGARSFAEHGSLHLYNASGDAHVTSAQDALDPILTWDAATEAHKSKTTATIATGAIQLARNGLWQIDAMVVGGAAAKIGSLAVLKNTVAIPGTFAAVDALRCTPLTGIQLFVISGVLVANAGETIKLGFGNLTDGADFVIWSAQLRAVGLGTYGLGG